MDMWDWLMMSYEQKCITLEELEKVMEDDIQAEILWNDWAQDSHEFIEWVRSEVKPFINYIKKKNKDE